MEKLKIGIIGVGNISSPHIEGYLNNPNCELYAFCDINAEVLAKKAERYGITRTYTDCNQMLKELPELDAVSICTWNNGHAPCTIAALEAGKHVFCEKPMAMNAEEAEAMKKAAEKAGKVLGMGFVRRFGRDADFARELVESGKTGDIYYAKANYIRRNGNPGGWFADKARSGGGPLIDLGVHVIDLVRYIMGNPRPVSVYGATFTKLFNRTNLKDPKGFCATDSKGKKDKCDVEDLACAMIRFENGSVLTIETSYSLHAGEDSGRIDLYGTKGGITIDPNITVHTEYAKRMADITFHSPTSFEFTEYGLEINNFIAAILEGDPLRASAQDGLEMMKILDAIYQSAETGHEVML